MQRYAPLLFVLALMAAAVPLAPAAQAQRGPSVCFYRDSGFRGPTYCIRPGDRVKFVGGKYNDKFSSVRIPRGVKATMCHDANFKGVCMTFDNSVSNFSILLFNDVISSVSAQWKDRNRRRGSSRGRHEDRRRAGGERICFYEHINFRGRRYCIRVGERVDFVGRRANDQFSSVRIPRGAMVRMCEHANFRGRCRTLYRSERNFVPMGFNDRVSAIAAQWERRRGWDDRDRRDWDRGRDRGRRRYDDDRRGRGQICFYEHAQFRGRRFCAPVGRSVSWVGRSNNDIFSSLEMPRGVRVTVCRDRGFRGPCKSFRGDVDFFGNHWNDTISSFRSR